MAGGLAAFAGRGSGAKSTKKPMHIPKAGFTFMVFIRGWEKAAQGFQNMPQKMEKRVVGKLWKVWQRVFERSQKDCPVGETGKLKRSGRVYNNSKPWGKMGTQFIDMRITYGGPSTDCDYAVYVHEGHRFPGGKGWVRGRPWLVRAVKKYRKSLYRECKFALREEWGKFCKQMAGYKGMAGTGQLGYKARVFGGTAGGRLGAGY